ncbi:MAG: patatin-like phospholipase family protein [Microscillaceae bacterium]|nr:patatin-like phospholipase family protein [Microscillaceae bacterium]MDW8461944.1 patatin-like phospholipase family protein [Cytophagales bacterium]
MFKTIDLALQGGGSHGAFTWGVLERLLEAESIVIEGICGTSAGAMNATMVAYGMHIGGRQGAIQMLEKFWRKIAEQHRKSIFQPSWIDRLFGNGRLDYSWGYNFMDIFTAIFSPYQYNPINLNPLKDLLEELVDFEVLRKSKAIKLFVCATNVKTARAKVFHNEEMCAEAVMASACLPYLFKAVEINGEAYWDGGFMGNPPIFPLIDDTETEDIVLVQINPIEIDYIPKTAVEIRDRINTISFNATLMYEMRKIQFVQKLLEKGINTEGKLRNLNIHNIAPPKEMERLGVSSKYNATWSFLQKLRKLGRQTADQWLKENYDALGHRSTCDVRKVFL